MARCAVGQPLNARSSGGNTYKVRPAQRRLLPEQLGDMSIFGPGDLARDSADHVRLIAETEELQPMLW